MPRLSTILLFGAALAGPVSDVRDVNGVLVTPFEPAGAANVLVFVSRDCPISNGYAPEIQDVCSGYRTTGIACTLVYEDLDADAALVRQHLRDYRFGGLTAVLDRDRAIAARANATVTPQAVLVDRAGRIRYRGRIDNLYVAFGKRRRHVTVHDLRDAIDAVLAGRPVPNPYTEALGCSITPPSFAR